MLSVKFARALPWSVSVVKLPLTLLLIPPVIALASCNVDLGLSCKKVAGSYCLEQWEDGETYYLRDKRGNPNAGGGAIDGVVRRIAWTSDLILVDRHALFRGDPDGWMVIDVRRRAMRGPVSEAEARSLFEQIRLRPKTASEAWRAMS